MTPHDRDGCRLFGAGPVLPVGDVQESVDYYCEHLGFTRDALSGTPPTHGSVTRDGVGIQFTSVPDCDVADDYPGWTYIWVVDVDRLYSEYRTRAVEITRELRDHEHGMREFEIRDHEGFRLRFGQYIE